MTLLLLKLVLMFISDVRLPSCDSSASFPGVNSGLGEVVLIGLVKIGDVAFGTFAGRVLKVLKGGAGSLYHLKSGFAEKNASLY